MELFSFRKTVDLIKNPTFLHKIGQKIMVFGINFKKIAIITI